MVRISFKKEREIGLSQISLTGSVTSVKNNSVIDFESSLERDFILIIEDDITINRYCEQPIKIYYCHKGQQKYYVPDFYIEKSDGVQQIVEVKYKADLAENKKEYEHKFNAAKELCDSNGMEFLVLSEDEIRDDNLFNIKFLLYYSNPTFEYCDSDFDLLMTNFYSNQPISVKGLLEVSSRDELKKMELLHVLWHLVVERFVSFDRELKLNMDTILFNK